MTGWVDLGGWLYTQLVYSIHPSTNWARRTPTILIETNVLPLSHAIIVVTGSDETALNSPAISNQNSRSHFTSQYLSSHPASWHWLITLTKLTTIIMKQKIMWNIKGIIKAYITYISDTFCFQDCDKQTEKYLKSIISTVELYSVICAEWTATISLLIWHKSHDNRAKANFYTFVPIDLNLSLFDLKIVPPVTCQRQCLYQIWSFYTSLILGKFKHRTDRQTGSNDYRIP